MIFEKEKTIIEPIDEIILDSMDIDYLDNYFHCNWFQNIEEEDNDVNGYIITKNGLERFIEDCEALLNDYDVEEGLIISQDKKVLKKLIDIGHHIQESTDWKNDTIKIIF